VIEDALAAFIRRERLPRDFRQSVETLHRPLAEAIIERRRAVDGPLVVGLCGPQGSGKSTGAEVIGILLEAEGLRTAILRLDDLYLTHAERGALSRRVHPLLATRGPPGTHDLGLGERQIEALKSQPSIAMPRFDKAIDDRSPPAGWPTIRGPADVVIFEGWCVGARAQAAEALDTPINALEAERDAGGVWRRYVNGALAGPYHGLFARIGFLAMLRPPAFEAILDWRLEQEHRLRQVRGGEAGLSDAAVAVFVQHYERIARHLDAEMPARADFVATLDWRRRPSAIAIAIA
jgi:D-glycerate 3-kinase